MTRRQIPILTSEQLKRYLAKIKMTRNIDECWEWSGAKIPKNNGRLFYGTFKNEKVGVQHNAHLWAYRYFIGPLNLELEIAHTCLNGLCCNWHHLVEVDHSTNQYMTTDAKFAKGQTCKNGHPRIPENTYYDTRGWRECLLCRKEASSHHYRKGR